LRRRTFLQLTGLGAAHFYLGGGGLGCAGGDVDPESDLFLGGFTTELPGELDHLARIEGRLPADLRGALYRNGPGLFERDGLRKTCIVDGDGMIRGFFVGDGEVRFRNRMIRTQKFLEEEAAGRFLYDSWATKVTPREPGIPNIGNQAGVSVRGWSGRLFAFDEGVYPYEIDPGTLDTLGLADEDFRHGSAVYAAHAKKLAATGEWAHVGVQFASGTLHLVIFDAALGVVESFSHQLSPIRYVHDFFATPTHLVVALQPAVFDLEVLLSGHTVRESMRWEPGLGTEWLVFERGASGPPQRIDGPAAWLWHTANAHLAGDELVCDWVAYDDADHFLAEDADLCAVMDGSAESRHSQGYLRRTVLNLATGGLTEESFAAAGPVEFPMVHPSVVGSKARHALMTLARDTDRIFPNALVRVDLETGATVEYDFGADMIVGEPVIAPRQGQGGWVLVEVNDVRRGRGALAVLHEEDLAAGPVAMAHLPHHLPISFHGDWVAQG